MHLGIKVDMKLYTCPTSKNKINRRGKNVRLRSYGNVIYRERKRRRERERQIKKTVK